MGGKNIRTGNRAKTRVVVKRDQLGTEDVQKKPTVERIVSGVEPVFRSIAKELIKGGIIVADSVSEFASETGEKFKDLLARSEVWKVRANCSR